MQQRRAQGDLEHLTVRQARVAPELHRQTVAGQLLLGLTQYAQGGFMPGGLASGFSVAFQQIQGRPGKRGGIKGLGVLQGDVCAWPSDGLAE